MSVEAKGKRHLGRSLDGRRVIQRTAAGVKGCDVKSSSLLLLGQPENRGDGSLDQTADLTEKHVSHGRSSENRRYFRSDKEKHLGGKCMKKKVLAALMCAAMTVGMLAGCGGNSTAGNTSADAGEAASGTDSADSGAGRREMDVEGDDVTTLEVWTFIENHQDFYTNMAEKWNEEIRIRRLNLFYPTWHMMICTTNYHLH